MRVEPTRIASAPASSASAPWARFPIALSATIEAVARRVGDQGELGAAVDLEGAEVACVDADDPGAERDRTRELLGVVRLDEEVEAELVRAVAA